MHHSLEHIAPSVRSKPEQGCQRQTSEAVPSGHTLDARLLGSTTQEAVLIHHLSQQRPQVKIARHGGQVQIVDAVAHQVRYRSDEGGLACTHKSTLAGDLG